MTPRLRALLDWYENLTPSSLARLDDLYAKNAFFKDPFNEVQSREAIREIFREMFERLEQPRFSFDEVIEEGEKAFVSWNFDFLIRKKAMRIHGSSLLYFDADGRISRHRDYWDAAGELYEKLPVIGWVIRRLRKMA